MSRLRFAMRAASVATLAYATVTAAMAWFPAWRYLPEGRLMPVSSQSCGSAIQSMLAVEEPAIRSKLLPIVMAREIDRGPETEISAASCHMVAEVVREASWLARAVPERFLCQSVRRWARSLYREQKYYLGAPIWIVDQRVVGSSGLYDLLTSHGLRLTRTSRGAEIQLTR